MKSVRFKGMLEIEYSYKRLLLSTWQNAVTPGGDLPAESTGR